MGTVSPHTLDGAQYRTLPVMCKPVPIPGELLLCRIKRGAPQRAPDSPRDSAVLRVQATRSGGLTGLTQGCVCHRPTWGDLEPAGSVSEAPVPHLSRATDPQGTEHSWNPAGSAPRMEAIHSFQMLVSEKHQKPPDLLLLKLTQPGLGNKPMRRKVNSPGFKFPRTLQPPRLSRKAISSLKATFPSCVVRRPRSQKATLSGAGCLTALSVISLCYLFLLIFFKMQVNKYILAKDNVSLGSHSSTSIQLNSINLLSRG